MDPALCRALAEIDSDTPGEAEPPVNSGPPGVEMERNWSQIAALYVRLGVVHILPRGVDHILFVLALFFATTHFRPLIIQVSVFTIAHTLTLALAATDAVSAPASVVEPLIAFSIAFVAVENLVFRDMTRWRPFIVFGFGLFHGLGFAGVLQGLGLPEGQFLAALVSFNAGVELGQITVIAGAWLLLHKSFSNQWYRSRIVIPASLLIALTGSWWAVERVLQQLS
jgi:hypothetical protein